MTRQCVTIIRRSQRNSFRPSKTTQTITSKRRDKRIRMNQHTRCAPSLFLCSILIFCGYITHTVESSSAAGQDTLIGIVGQDFIMIGADSSVSQSIALTASNLDKIAVLVEPFPPQDERRLEQKQQLNRRHAFVVDGINRQQTIVAAAAGDNADADRLIGLLSARCAIREYEQGVGCDVDYVQVVSDSDDGTTATATTKKAPPVSLQTGEGGGLTATSIAHLARTQISHSLRTRERMNVCLLVAGMVPSTREPQLQQQEHMEIQNDGSSSSSSSSSSNSSSQNDDTKFFQRLQWQVEKASNKVSLKRLNDKSIADTMDINHFVSDEELSKHDEDDDNEDNDDLSLSTDETLDIDDVSPPPCLKPQLFWLDEYGSIQNIQYGSHGLGSNFILSILDRQYSPNISRKEAITLIHDCFHQLRTRYVINNPQPPCIKCVDAHGCQLILQ